MDIAFVLALVAVSFGLGIYFESGGRGRDKPKEDAREIKKILNRNKGLLCRIDGSVAGVVTNDSKEYPDKDLGVQRERIEYFDLDGERRVEPRDGFNPKRGSLQSLVKTSPNSPGVYITEVVNPKTGDRIPFEKGRSIERLREEADNIQAVKKEVNEMSEEYRSMKSRMKQLETKKSKIAEERDELVRDMDEYQEAVSRQRRLIESLQARTESAEAKAHMLQVELRNIADIHDDAQEDVQEILEKAKNRFETGREMGAAPELPNIPSLREPEEQGATQTQPPEESSTPEEGE